MDVKRAFLYGRARRDIYLKLPKEDENGCNGHVLGKLERSLYGTRDAPQIWQDEVRGNLEQMGYSTCASQPGVYVHPISGVKLLAHVDDIMAMGPENAL